MATNCTRLIEVEKLSFADNVRTPECMKVPAIVDSFRRHGFKMNHPLVVHEESGDDGAKYLVLIGNRRGHGLVWLRDNDPEEYRRILPNGKVPAVVHKGLTAEEVVDMRIDHSSDEDRVPLDEWSTFLAIQQLVKVGMDTQERIAIKLGLWIKGKGKNAGQPNRSFVQPRVNLARLPQFVQEQFEKLCREGKDGSPVRWLDVAKLYKAFFAEYTQHPEGDGPGFQKVWKDVMTPPTVEDSDDSAIGSASEPKELSPAEAIKRSQAASSEGLKYALLVVTRQSDRNLAEIDAKILEGETAIRVLGEIKAYLGEKDYVALLSGAGQRASENGALEEVTADPPAEESYEHPDAELAPAAA